MKYKITTGNKTVITLVSRLYLCPGSFLITWFFCGCSCAVMVLTPHSFILPTDFTTKLTLWPPTLSSVQIQLV